MIQTRPINRKFYNKWCYKLSLRCKGAGMLRYQTIEEILSFLAQDNAVVHKHGIKMQARENSRDVCTLMSALIMWPKDQYATRIENQTVDIYTNNQLLFDEVSKQCNLFTWRRFAPDTNVALLLTEEKRVLCRHLPHKKYQYKVFLTPHKLPTDDSSRSDFLNFAKANHNSILISQSVCDWFMNTKWNWDRRYLFVDNEKTLLMLKLKSCNAVGTYYKYIPI